MAVASRYDRKKTGAGSALQDALCLVSYLTYSALFFTVFRPGGVSCFRYVFSRIGYTSSDSHWLESKGAPARVAFFEWFIVDVFRSVGRPRRVGKRPTTA